MLSDSRNIVGVQEEPQNPTLLHLEGFRCNRSSGHGLPRDASDLLDSMAMLFGGVTQHHLPSCKELESSLGYECEKEKMVTENGERQRASSSQAVPLGERALVSTAGKMQWQ